VVSHISRKTSEMWGTHRFVVEQSLGMGRLSNPVDLRLGQSLGIGFVSQCQISTSPSR